MAEEAAGDARRGGALGRVWRRAKRWLEAPKAWWSDLSAQGRERVVRRVGTAFAGFAVLLFMALAVGFGYLAVQVIEAFGAIRDLDYGALEDETLVVVFRNLLWGVSAAAGAAVAVLGVGLAGWRTVTQHRQSQIEQRRVETETFSKAMELLGNDVFAIRLGGILQLETLAQQSRRLHWPIMEAFCAYLRETGESVIKDKVETSEKNFDSEPIHTFTAESEAYVKARTHGEEACPQDIQAIITAIIRRDKSKDPQGVRIDLSNALLSGADLSWSNLDFYIFTRAQLNNVNFMGASLKNVNLNEANLVKSYLRYADLSGAYLMSTNLESAFLRDANFSSTECALANFRGADFKRTNIFGAKFGASYVSQDQIEMCVGDSHTSLREDLIRPAQWDG
jgi:hypothetical protein